MATSNYHTQDDYPLFSTPLVSENWDEWEWVDFQDSFNLSKRLGSKYAEFITLEAGYYAGAQLFVVDDPYRDFFKYEKKYIIKEMKRIAKDLDMIELSIAYRFSNGETGYNIVGGKK